MTQFNAPIGQPAVGDNPFGAAAHNAAPPASTQVDPNVPPGTPPTSDTTMPGGNAPAARVDPNAAKSLPDPGVVMRGGRAASVQTPEEADAVRERNINPRPAPPPPVPDMSAFGNTPLDSHPPLKKGDRIQGPNDRTNREPTPAELDHGRIALGLENSDAFKDVIVGEPEFKDPPIEDGAPKDQPADPRRVAESRGMLKPRPDVKVARSPALEPNVPEEEDDETALPGPADFGR